MLIPRSELEYDFQGARFDLELESDRKLLAWIFNQFLYGEVTGIQCGHWLYRAPSLSAASFLARQAAEELSHVRKILRILSLLGEKPALAHWSVRALSTGMMGSTWGEHVTLEMALGEGLVLSVFYAMAQTIAHPEIQKILETAISEEERHVEFGERETRDWLGRRPGSRSYLVGLALVQLWVLQRLKNFVSRRVVGSQGREHPVLGHFDAFYSKSLKGFETRIERLGLCDRPLSRLAAWRKGRLLAGIPWGWVKARVAYRHGILTSTYLNDPALTSEQERYRSS